MELVDTRALGVRASRRKGSSPFLPTMYKKPYIECLETELQLICPNCHVFTDNYRGKARVVE